MSCLRWFVDFYILVLMPIQKFKSKNGSNGEDYPTSTGLDVITLQSPSLTKAVFKSGCPTWNSNLEVALMVVHHVLNWCQSFLLGIRDHVNFVKWDVEKEQIRGLPSTMILQSSIKRWHRGRINIYCHYFIILLIWSL